MTTRGASPRYYPNQLQFIGVAVAAFLVGVPLVAQSSSCPPSASRTSCDSARVAYEYLDGALAFIQQNSVDRERVDWPRLRAEAHTLAQGARSQAGTYAAIRQVLTRLADRHSRFFPPGEARALAERGQARGFGFRAVYPEGTIVQVYPGSAADRAGLHVGDTLKSVNHGRLSADARGVLVEFPGDTVRISVIHAGRREVDRLDLVAGLVAVNSPPISRRLPGGVGYVLLPEHLGAGDVPGAGRYADLGHEALRSADTPPACGWIVDLRRNGGGNMWPMLSAIGPVLGDGQAGAFVGPGAVTTAWSYHRGRAEASARPAAAATDAYTLRRDSLPVAVLTSRVTGSAGEAIAVAFRGRAHVRSFGEPTEGVPTANTVHQLPDGALLVLTTAVDADRTGTTYRDRIPPDEPVPLDWTHFGDDADPVIKHALRWLRDQPSCR